MSSCWTFDAISLAERATLHTRRSSQAPFEVLAGDGAVSADLERCSVASTTRGKDITFNPYAIKIDRERASHCFEASREVMPDSRIDVAFAQIMRNRVVRPPSPESDDETFVSERYEIWNFRVIRLARSPLAMRLT